MTRGRGIEARFSSNEFGMLVVAKRERDLARGTDGSIDAPSVLGMGSGPDDRLFEEEAGVKGR